MTRTEAEVVYAIRNQEGLLLLIASRSMVETPSTPQPKRASFSEAGIQAGLKSPSLRVLSGAQIVLTGAVGGPIRSPSPLAVLRPGPDETPQGINKSSRACPLAEGRSRQTR